MTVNWTHQSAHVIAAAVQAGEVTAEQVLQEHFAAIDLRNNDLHCVTDLVSDRAIQTARMLDRRKAAGDKLPPLAGVPIAVKNLFDIAGVVTRAGSKINRDNPPATRDATLITRLEAAGAVLTGALNMGEYAYDFTGRNAHDQHSRNPHDPERMTGGSSGGSGGAVAAGLAAITLGSDTNGSIRVPASLCGVFGLKPTYGALSRAGTFPFVASLDHLGPLARSAMDLALAYDAMRGTDPLDPACNGGGTAVTPEINKGLDGLRIARAGGYFTRMGSPQAFAAIDAVAIALGSATVVELPEVHRARAAAFTITMIEGASLHRDRIRTRPQDFDPEVRDRLIAGAMLPGDWYVKAQKFRRWFREETLKLFKDVDLILAPATPVSAPLVGQRTFYLDGQELPVRPNMGIFTQPISFVGLPVVTVPSWPRTGMPIGVQIIAAPGHEAKALRAAYWLEQNRICRSPAAPAAQQQGAKTNT